MEGYQEQCHCHSNPVPGRAVVHVAEIIPWPGLPDALRVPREPVPAAAGGAVGHLKNKQTSVTNYVIRIR